MKISVNRIGEAAEHGSDLSVLRSPEYRRAALALRRAFLEFESKVKAAGYKLAMDRHGEYSLTAIPAELDVAGMAEPELAKLLDDSYGLGNEPITII